MSRTSRRLVIAIATAGAGCAGHSRQSAGDSGSFDEKLVMLGRLVTPDSIVGTWSETILCCSAGGRFTLWRTPPGS